MQASVYLHPGREKSLRRRHPWLFSKAISKVNGHPKAGANVDVFDSEGNWLARGAFSPESQIRVRIWTFDKAEKIDHVFFKNRIRLANDRRQELIERGRLTGYRVVAAESDGLPGITIDKYADTLVCQLLSAGAEFHKAKIVDALKSQFPGCCVYERSDVDVRKKEGLEPTTGVLHGDTPDTHQIIEENGVKLLVDVVGGHKTGFYLDQRDNRKAAADYVKDKEVLNCFSYTGTFSVYALRAGAKKVVNVDVSKPALELAKRNAQLNDLDLSRLELMQQDVFLLLRRYRDEGRQFDTIILDPPKFVENKAHLNRACRGYKDINMLAMQILKPGGTLLTFSCSGLMAMDLFQKVVADAALDAGRTASIQRWLHQAGDHPVASCYPEGLYLKGLVLKMD